MTLMTSDDLGLPYQEGSCSFPADLYVHSHHLTSKYKLGVLRRVREGLSHTHMPWGGAIAFPKLFWDRRLRPCSVTWSDQIWHGNTWGGVFLEGQGRPLSQGAEPLNQIFWDLLHTQMPTQYDKQQPHFAGHES